VRLSSVKMIGLFVTALVGLYTIEDLWEKFGDLKMSVVRVVVSPSVLLQKIIPFRRFFLFAVHLHFLYLLAFIVVFHLLSCLHLRASPPFYSQIPVIHLAFSSYLPCFPKSQQPTTLDFLPFFLLSLHVSVPVRPIY
jgi:hypothetical protein